MSAGPFERTFYQMDAGNGGFTLACKVQPETLDCTIEGVANAAPAGPADAPGSATISQGRRTAGVNMRYVSMVWTGTAPAGYDENGILKIPVLDPATFAAWTLLGTGTYLGNAVQIIGRNGETVR